MPSPKPQARQPALTLHAAAQALADTEHARRTAELKTLAPQLVRLDALMPALKARGLELHPSNLSLEFYRPTGYFGRAYVMVRLGLYSWSTSEQPLLEARWKGLHELGFSVVEWGSPDGSYPVAVLRRGPLLLTMRRPASIVPPAKASAAAQKEDTSAEVPA